MKIELLGFPTTLGIPRPDRRHAPEVLRAAGLLDLLRQHASAVADLGDMSLSAGQVADSWPDRVQKVVDSARRQVALWQERHEADSLMLTVGGDHSTALGTLLTLAARGEEFDVIWIDAHGDFNTLATSPSGNPHGMVLSLACGLLPHYLDAHLHPSQLHLWGIRDLDEGERRLLEHHRVEVRTPDQVRQRTEAIIANLKPNVYLSFDIDSVDPSEAPGTGTPVPNGFRTAEALHLVTRIAQTKQVLALDLVEFHPDKDQNDMTRELSLAVIRTVIEEQVRRRQTEDAAH
ncbi:MAG TPA: arginase family protein [Symbiobacteriaceae bacterium]|nr:arginase family protein [Symbiobacteriaceae bacterium]